MPCTVAYAFGGGCGVFSISTATSRVHARRERATAAGIAGAASMLAILYWDPGATGGTNLGGNGTWDATSAVWYDPSAGADVAWTNGDTAAFKGQPGTVSIAAQISAGSIVFNTATGGMGYILSGESLSLSAGASTIEVDSDPAAITSIIAGAGGLTKTGAGMLVLGGREQLCRRHRHRGRHPAGGQFHGPGRSGRQPHGQRRATGPQRLQPQLRPASPSPSMPARPRSTPTATASPSPATSAPARAAANSQRLAPAR